MWLQEFKTAAKLSQVFFVGDLHGRFTLLKQALEAVGFDPQKGHILVCTGDLIDVGRENEACLALLDEPWFKTVLGNHDQFMLAHGKISKTVYGNLADWLIEEQGLAKLNAWYDEDNPKCTVEELHPDLTLSVAQWLLNGGAWWFCAPKVGGWAARQQLLKKVEAMALPFALTCYVENRVFGVVHAGLPRLRWPNAQDVLDVDCLIWDRALFSKAAVMGADDHAIRVEGVDALIMGHNIVKAETDLDQQRSLHRGNLCFIDAGAKIGRIPTVIRADVLLSEVLKVTS